MAIHSTEKKSTTQSIRLAPSDEPYVVSTQQTVKGAYEIFKFEGKQYLTGPIPQLFVLHDSAGVPLNRYVQIIKGRVVALLEADNIALLCPRI